MRHLPGGTAACRRGWKNHLEVGNQPVSQKSGQAGEKHSQEISQGERRSDSHRIWGGEKPVWMAGKS